MTQEQKDLLLQDLCCRLPHEVILNCCNLVGEKLYTIDSNGLVNNDYDLEEVKPYLFPLSSMTEKQRKEYHNLCSVGADECGDVVYFDTYESIDYLNKNKFDYRYLIPMELALDATGKSIYSYENNNQNTI